MGAHATHPVLLAVLLAWLVPALWWWNKHRVRHVHTEDEPGPGEPDPDQLLEDLREHVCGKGGSVAGADVSEMPPVKGGRRFEFSLIRGKQHVGTVTSARASIASAAGVSLSRVLTEGVPSGIPGERGPEHLAMVTILNERHPQQEIQEFTGPTLDMATGLFHVGPYPDSEMAQARLFKVDEHGQPIRACSGLTSGAQGSGKSRYAERMALEHLASGLFAVMLIDGQMGTSIPDLTEWAHWPALQPAEWDLCFRALLRLMFSRSARMAAKRMAHWDPEMGPFVHVQVEEAHVPLGVASNLRASKTLIQNAEKNGIGITFSTQFPSQVELGASSGGPGANVLRDLASSGNVTLFRTGGQFAKNVTVGQVEVAPHLLPQLPGICYALGVSMREAPARSIRAAHPASWAARFAPVKFSPEDIEALDGTGEAFSRRHDRLEEHMAAAARGMDAGTLDEQVALVLGETADGKTSTAEREQKTTAMALVWEILGDGPMKRADLLEEVDRRGHSYSPSAIDQALKALEAQPNGIRKGAEFGVWERRATLSVVNGGSNHG
jgi:hypothetical protein